MGVGFLGESTRSELDEEEGMNRMQSPRAAVVAGTLLALAVLAIAPAVATTSGAPTPAAARLIALDDLARHAADFGVSAGDVAEAAVTDVVPTAHNGVTSVYLRQRVNGLEIDGAEAGIHLDARGRVFYRTGRLVSDVSSRAAEAPSFPLLTADQAVLAAASKLGLAQVNSLTPVRIGTGADRAVTFVNRGLSEEPIPVRLRYYRTPDTDRLTLAWNLDLKGPGTSDWWDVWVDAETGDLVGRVNWTSDATYRVFAEPKESPSDGPRTDEVDPWDVSASPYGWHDTDGSPGAESTLTTGNNVNACTDIDANNACDPGSQPDGGPSLVFQPALDLTTQDPSQYRDAAVVNLFYWNNVVHDIYYQYGFDEPAGNFQVNNYGNGGNGNDPVNADAQDGSGTNNANFATPPDGSRPRMQMFVWTYPITHEVVVNATAYDASPTAGLAGGWGADPPDQTGVTGPLHLADDGTGTTSDACEPLVGTYTNEVVIIDRGSCEFGLKALHAQQAGAIGAIIVNNQGDGLLVMGAGASGSQVTIAVLFVGQTDGTTIKGQVPSPAQLHHKDPAGLPPNRDSDLDAGVIAHEYGHGVSNRLTGGPAASGCLSNGEEAGEGWSDWMTLFIHAAPGETATTSRPIGTYVSFQDPNTGAGIRRYPYNTDMGIDPLTYGNLAANPEVHAIGEVWAIALWEMYWNLVNVYGYDSDIYHGTGGNNLAFQLSFDGMKLQPCSPGFVDARDAILAADQAGYEGDDLCDIWRAFAKRGLGANASEGSPNVAGDETEDFSLPAQCENLIFSSGFGPRWGDRWSTVAP
jgi:extracellular elastinolytic metalloproteinase